MKLFKIPFLFGTILAISVFTVGGCSLSPTFTKVFGVSYVSGMHFLPETLNQLEVNKTTKEEVLKLMGSPTFTGANDQNTWYYLYQKTWYIATIKEKMIAHQLITLQFDSKGILTVWHQQGLESFNDKLELSPMADPQGYAKRRHLKPDLYPSPKHEHNKDSTSK